MNNEKIYRTISHSGGASLALWHRGTGDRNCLRCVDDRDRSKASETEISDYFLERRKPKYGDQGVNKEVKKETKKQNPDHKLDSVCDLYRIAGLFSVPFGGVRKDKL